MKRCLYLDSRWNLCFTLTVTASVSWEIPQNLTIFFASFPVKFTCEGVFLLKLQAVLYQLQFYQRWTSCTRFFFNFWQKLSTNQFSDGYFHLLLSSKLFSEKNSVLLKLPHLTLAAPGLFDLVLVLVIVPPLLFKFW